jgi:NADH:ubiquinone oxidoreductase subunit 6 (subunit J)
VPDSSVSLRQRSGPAVLAAVVIGYSLGAAATKPFTTAGNVITALPIVVLAVAVVVRWPLRTGVVRLPRRQTGSAGHPYRPWVVLFAVLAAWEVFSYLVRGSRADHPTFSSITDAIDRYYVFKVVLFAVWLAVGWLVLQRGARRTARGSPGQDAP